MRAQLTTKIPLIDGRENVTREREVATFAGLLAKAHEEGRKRIETELLQVRSEDNHFVAIARAVVETDKGVSRASHPSISKGYWRRISLRN